MNRIGKALLALVVIALTAAALTGCCGVASTTTNQGGQPGSNPKAFRILAGSTIKTIEPVLKKFFEKPENGDATIEYMGSVDVSAKLKQKDAAAIGYDAVWPESTIWIELGDTGKNVKDKMSIMRSPVVFGVKKSRAAKLGWIGNPVMNKDVLAAAEAGNFNFVMPSATQSDAGNRAFMAFLYAFNGQKMVTMDALSNPEIGSRLKRLYRTVNRSAKDEMWQNEFFVKNYSGYDGQVNYESLIIAANKGQAGGIIPAEDPIYVVYPEDGLSIADCPLGYIDAGDAAKREIFDRLQAYLLSPEGQREIGKYGWRTGFGINIADADKSVFNPSWGINTEKVLNTVKIPKTDVVKQSMTLYQTAFRKPSFTVYVLDYSPSMQEEVNGRTGRSQLEEAMAAVLDPSKASEDYIQPGPSDVTVVVPFAGEVMDERRVVGNDPTELARLQTWLKNLPPEEATAIFSGVDRAYEVIKKEPRIEDYFPAIILMTDGESNSGTTFKELAIRQGQNARSVPVFAIPFGSAQKDQLQPLVDAAFSKGKIIEGSNLKQAFKDAKGYN